MSKEELAREREELIARYGPWLAQNIEVGDGVFTMGSPRVFAAERRIARTVQLVADTAGAPLSQLRILDLGAYECGFAIELAEHGAEVVAVEFREQHAAKGEWVRRARGLDNLKVVQGDIRELDSLVEGEFDVVLCLGLIYHLGADDAVALLRDIARRTRRFAVVEGQISLSRRETATVDGVEYSGLLYGEDERDPGSGVNTPHAFWFTRASLMRALANAGFSTVAEVQLPDLRPVVPFEDHVTLLAFTGERQQMRAVPQDPAGPADPYPEAWELIAHPTQGLRYRLRERLARMRGGGMKAIFPDDQA